MGFSRSEPHGLSPAAVPDPGMYTRCHAGCGVYPGCVGRVYREAYTGWYIGREAYPGIYTTLRRGIPASLRRRNSSAQRYPSLPKERGEHSAQRYPSLLREKREHSAQRYPSLLREEERSLRRGLFLPPKEPERPLLPLFSLP